MLHVIFGRDVDAVFNTAVYFKNAYEDEWITDDFGRQVILDVDKSTVIGNSAIDSPVLGVISPINLSGGVKTILLIKHELDVIFNASTCGDNCAKWILKIAEERDVTINLRHIMNFGNGEFAIHIVNTNEVVRNMKEFMLVAGMFV